MSDDSDIEAAQAVVEALEAVQTARALDDGGPAKKKKKWMEDWLKVRDSPQFSLVWEEFYRGNRQRFFTTFRHVVF